MMSLGLRSYGVAVLLAMAPQSVTSAQAIANKLTISLETPLVAFERVSFESDPDLEPGEVSASSYERLSVGLGAGSNGNSGVTGLPAAIGLDVGYVLAEPLVIGLRLGVGWDSGDSVDRSVHSELDRWSITAGPHAEVVFGSGWLRPFAGVELRLITSTSSTETWLEGDDSGETYLFERNVSLWTAGAVAGAHAFVTDAFAIDMRLAASFGLGSLRVEEPQIPAASREDGGAIASRVTRERGFDRFDLVLHLGVSGWI